MPNQALRQLIIEEYNYDPIAGTMTNNADESQAAEDDDEPEQSIETEDQAHTNGTFHQESSQSNDYEDRVDDLLNLVDEQIRNNNQGL